MEELIDKLVKISINGELPIMVRLIKIEQYGYIFQDVEFEGTKVGYVDKKKFFVSHSTPLLIIFDEELN